MKTKLLVAAVFALTAGVVIGYPYAPGETQPNVAPIKPVLVATPNARPKVDVVFVLDTTGSMSGLIQAAKDNIWSIATTMASAKPTPDIRIGLVAFRDRGDQYVTQVVDLSADLDSMYATLMDFSADGGGDTNESVNQALNDAVTKMSWSADRSSYKVVFLVGDAPPHMDYQDDVKYPETLKAAAAKGIVVNTILAGGDSYAQQEWQQIASLSQGKFFQVDQSGDAIAVTTPFDAQIAKLSQALDETRMFFGNAEKQRELAGKEAATDKLHAEGSMASRAKRAAFNASASGKANLLGENELVDAVSSGRVDLSTLDQAELPAPLRSLSKEEQATTIKQAAAQRAEINTQIQALADQRRSYVDAELKNREGTETSLDYQIFNTVKAQAAEKGLVYATAPAN